MKKHILFALLACFAAVPALAEDTPTPPALMAPVVAVVDIQAILHDSNASKGVREQLAAKRDAYQKEILASEQKLRDAQQKLIKERSTLTEAQFNEKRQSFEKDVREVQQTVQRRARTLDAAMNGALNEIRKTVGQIIAEAAKAKGANLVLDKAQVVVVDAKLDLTKEVMASLNQKLPKVNVTFTEPKAPAKTATK